MSDNNNFGCSVVALVIFWLFAGIFFVIAKSTDSVLLGTWRIVFGVVAIAMGVSALIDWLILIRNNNHKQNNNKMNKERRARLAEVDDLLMEAVDDITEIVEDEQEAFDNLPEGLQCSSRGEAMEEAIDEMNDIISDIENVRERIQDFTGIK